MAKTDIVRTLVEPLAAARDAAVYDVTFNAGRLHVAITRADGIDLDTLADISRELGEQLDADNVIGGSYTLEVSSPGLERPLRTPEHFAGAVGESVTIRTTPDTEGERRVRGTITASDDTTVTVDLEDPSEGDDGARTIELTAIERARTTFTWDPAPKPGQDQSGGTNKHQNQKARS
ncbi:MAG: ribosome maturation factor RimP [Acidimicrobiales bacterium]|nr:ribosome maturation factor RimP [Acidimicrobiales bacterium]